mmetsp:Transcript_6618/g.18554  ORF Transcript_6618/g.18554 Transcript_6618/m.18554 type:complete len:393 (-) Transcript_6618:206-1384(-)
MSDAGTRKEGPDGWDGGRASSVASRAVWGASGCPSAFTGRPTLKATCTATPGSSNNGAHWSAKAFTKPSSDRASSNAERYSRPLPSRSSSSAARLACSATLRARSRKAPSKEDVSLPPVVASASKPSSRIDGGGGSGRCCGAGCFLRTRGASSSVARKTSRVRAFSSLRSSRQALQAPRLLKTQPPLSRKMMTVGSSKSLAAASRARTNRSRDGPRCLPDDRSMANLRTRLNCASSTTTQRAFDASAKATASASWTAGGASSQRSRTPAEHRGNLLKCGARLRRRKAILAVPNNVAARCGCNNLAVELSFFADNSERNRERDGCASSTPRSSLPFQTCTSVRQASSGLKSSSSSSGGSSNGVVLLSTTSTSSSSCSRPTEPLPPRLMPRGPF